jgi:hypothetical protein
MPLPSETPGLGWRERRRLRKAESAYGMDPETRKRTAQLLREWDEHYEKLGVRPEDK